MPHFGYFHTADCKVFCQLFLSFVPSDTVTVMIDLGRVTDLASVQRSHAEGLNLAFKYGREGTF